jgi:hypothetical protein
MGLLYPDFLTRLHWATVSHGRILRLAITVRAEDDPAKAALKKPLYNSLCNIQAQTHRPSRDCRIPSHLLYGLGIVVWNQLCDIKMFHQRRRMKLKSCSYPCTKIETLIGEKDPRKRKHDEYALCPKELEDFKGCLMLPVNPHLAFTE